MEKKMVYVVESIADWHNTDRETQINVFEDFNSAYDFVLKDVKATIKGLTRKKRNGYQYCSEIEVEKYTDNGAYIMTDREDYIEWGIHCAKVNN